MLSFLEVPMGHCWPSSQLDVTHFQYCKFGLVWFSGKKCPIRALSSPPRIIWRFHLDFLKHVYILGSFYCVRFPYYLLMTLNFNCVSPYPPPISLSSSSPLVSVPVTTTPIYLSLSILFFFLSENSLSLSSPLLYTYPLWLWLQLNYHCLFKTKILNISKYISYFFLYYLTKYYFFSNYINLSVNIIISF